MKEITAAFKTIYEVYGLTKELLINNDRRTAEARYIMAYLLYYKTDNFNQADIAKILNVSREVIHSGLKKIIGYIETDKEFKAKLEYTVSVFDREMQTDEKNRLTLFIEESCQLLTRLNYINIEIKELTKQLNNEKL